MRNLELMSYIGEHISPELFKRMGEWLEQNPVEIYWDYNDKLSESQIDMLLRGDRFGFEDGLWVNLIEGQWMWEEERQMMRNSILEFIDEILGGMAINEDDLDDGDLDEIGEAIDLRYEVITNLNAHDLVRNTRVHLTLDLELEHEYMPQDEYDAADEILTFFNINPHIMWLLFNGYFNTVQDILDYGNKPIRLNPDDGEPWPDIPERNGHEFVDPIRLFQSWINMPYSGEYVALLGGSLDLLTLAYAIEEADEDGKYLELTLPPNTPLVTHAYWPGSGGTFFYLKKEMKVRIVKENQLARDGAFKYGVQDVHGLVSEMWDTEFKFEIKEGSNEQVSEDTY